MARAKAELFEASERPPSAQRAKLDESNPW
jgi:hypothetical protein